QDASTNDVSSNCSAVAGKHDVVHASQAEIHRHVWRRDRLKCTNCGSTFATEIDHRIPKAKGGTNSAENLRVLCKACNQRAAIEVFGHELMDKFLT
ncbi:MAG TPA: HNH endonuclease signature motif containing protein, partial [Bdellovibrionales bacterium]|nr:HNH endonuclease signature motif containing protein [Bdellovibrionales bacterium]